jgi:hypothetical protein
MGTAVRPAKTSPGPWDAFADVDVFVDEVLKELAVVARDRTRPQRSGPKPPLAGAALRKAVMAIWCVCFCGMQWRAIGQLCDIPFNTLSCPFSRGLDVDPHSALLLPVDFADTGMRGGGRALSDG